MSFTFSFSGDDIDPDEWSDTGAEVIESLQNVNIGQQEEKAELIPPRRHNLDEMVRFYEFLSFHQLGIFELYLLFLCFMVQIHPFLSIRQYFVL